jgi:uncharacterized protein
MRLMIACAAAALLATALPVDTARAAQAPPAATAPSERQTELTRRYLNLMMTDQFESVIHQMLGAELANDEGMQALPEADRRFIVGLTAELTGDMVPQMITEMVPVYAAVFTEEELVALVAFYETPLGRSIAEKSVRVMPEADRAVMALVPQMLEKMAMRMCQHYGCTPAELEQLRQGMREGAGMEQGAARK